MRILEAHHIKHSIKDRELFSIEHLVVHAKDRIGLVGKNGSGKTTLLNLLAGNIPPEQGTIHMHTSVELLPQLKRSVIKKRRRSDAGVYCRSFTETNRSPPC